MSVEPVEKSESYYEVLEVTAHASDEEVKRAYRRLALQHHPDRSRAQDRGVAALRFRLINEAYAHLKTPERRAAYNEALKAQNDNRNTGLSFWAQFGAIFAAPKKSKIPS